jgi:hypothetical protein
MMGLFGFKAKQSRTNKRIRHGQRSLVKCCNTSRDRKRDKKGAYFSVFLGLKVGRKEIAQKS